MLILYRSVLYPYRIDLLHVTQQQKNHPYCSLFQNILEPFCHQIYRYLYIFRGGEFSLSAIVYFS